VRIALDANRYRDLTDGDASGETEDAASLARRLPDALARFPDRP